MASLEQVEEIIGRHETIFDSVETISVKSAPAIVQGRPDPANSHIEVIARRPDRLDFPATLEGVEIHKLAATMEEQALRYSGLAMGDAPALANEWRTGLLRGPVEAPRDYTKLTYRPFNPSKLRTVDAPCALTLNVSPDTGWPVLEEFLAEEKNFKVAMYDLTAPHIVKALEAIGNRGGSLELCLGPHASYGSGTKKDDIGEETVKKRLEDAFGDSFRFAWASVGPSRQFPSAYHIKVAVREGTHFWLSSGNWQSSNQPDHRFAGEVEGPPADGAGMAKYNRDWHILVESNDLAEIFSDYIDKDHDSAEFEAGEVEAGRSTPITWAPVPLPADEDFTLEFRVEDTPELAVVEAAKPYRRAFPPLELPRKKRRITPLLTPDNYGEEVLALIESATTRLWFQNQSLSINANPSPLYRKLLKALREKAWDIEDSRIFFRDFIRADTQDQLRKLDREGFPMQKVRNMTNVHTKGIIVDDHLTLIGSHNWTNEGTNYNRDASLIIEDEDVNAWYRKVMDHDWNSLAFRVSYDLEAPSAVLPLRGEEVPGTPVRLDPRMDIAKPD